MAIHCRNPDHNEHSASAMCHGINHGPRGIHPEEFEKTREDWKCKKCAKAYSQWKEWKAKQAAQSKNEMTMISFRQFLIEETEGQWAEFEGGGRHRVSYNTKIGPHHINLMFAGEKRGTYTADFTVDHKVRQLDTDNPYGVRILRHVQKRIDDFVRRHKPRSLITPGATDKHDKVYKYHRETLARKYQGRVDNDNDEVFFNHKKAQEAGVQY